MSSPLLRRERQTERDHLAQRRDSEAVLQMIADVRGALTTLIPADSPDGEMIALVGTAMVFADLLAALPVDDEFLECMNSDLAEAGLTLVRTIRH